MEFSGLFLNTLTLKVFFIIHVTYYNIGRSNFNILLGFGLFVDIGTKQNNACRFH